MIERNEAIAELKQSLNENPVVALLGPRQCGKSTLARVLAEKADGHWFDLETAQGMAAMTQPELALKSLAGLVVIDEIQRRPELFAALRPLVDRRNFRAKFLLLGSASPHIVKGVSESLAGRVGFVDLHGFHLGEVGTGHRPTLVTWRIASIFSCFKRCDEPAVAYEFYPHLFGTRYPSARHSDRFRNLATFLDHGGALSWSNMERGGTCTIARGFGTDGPTISRYPLRYLYGETFAIVAYQPRQAQTQGSQNPSARFRALHSLLGIQSRQELFSHPKLGASWEGFAMEQVLAQFGDHDAYYWGTHNGAELDLLLFRNGTKWGFEFKVNDGPRMTKSLHAALRDLDLERAWIVYPGETRYPIHERVEAIPLRQLDLLSDVL